MSLHAQQPRHRHSHDTVAATPGLLAMAGAPGAGHAALRLDNRQAAAAGAAPAPRAAPRRARRAYHLALP
jgi:hypothetical protein